MALGQVQLACDLRVSLAEHGEAQHLLLVEGGRGTLHASAELDRHRNLTRASAADCQPKQAPNLGVEHEGVDACIQKPPQHAAARARPDEHDVRIGAPLTHHGHTPQLLGRIGHQADHGVDLQPVQLGRSSCGSRVLAAHTFSPSAPGRSIAASLEVTATLSSSASAPSRIVDRKLR